VEKALPALYSYCKNENWVGYDPYDALNSKIFRTLPFKHHKHFRLLYLQFNKKSMINFRPLLIIRKGRNPKGIGLFLFSILSLYKKDKDKQQLDLIEQFVKWLKEDVSPGYSGDCWGYNFDWQSRAFFLPKDTPTAVNTSFIVRAFLKAHEVMGKKEYLKIARSSCDFILNDLNRLEENDTICFSYSPIDHYFVHNATALASSLLAGVYAKTGENELAEVAKQSITYVVRHQNDDGSWYYGEDKTARRVGIDNFHTGFILESLKVYAEATGDNDCTGPLRRGVTFYQDNFFLADGAPKYYHNKTYPLDIHGAAQAVVTLVRLKDLGADMGLCERIVTWMIENMQDEKGYFYYQKGRFFTNKIPYMRWAQAWAFRALTDYYLNQENK
jgi:rhamnogalacturonyl hydrolase YesR